jgi:hypothetical protein
MLQLPNHQNSNFDISFFDKGFTEKQAVGIKDIVQEVLHSSIDHQTKVLVTKAQMVGTQ